MGKRVVNERVSMGQKGITGGVISLNAVLREKPAHLDVHSASQGREIRLAVKLDGVDPIQVGPAITVGQLSVEDAAWQGEAVIGSRQDPVGAKSKCRFRC